MSYYTWNQARTTFVSMIQLKAPYWLLLKLYTLSNAYFASWRRRHFTHIELSHLCNTNYSLCLDKGFRSNYKKLSQIIHCFFKNTVLFSCSFVLPRNDKLVKYWKPRSRSCYGRASISSVIFVYIQFENWALCQMKWWLVILIYQYYYIRII